MDDIEFEHECWPPHGDVIVRSDFPFDEIVIYKKKTGAEVAIEKLAELDRINILNMVSDWKKHHEYLEREDIEPLPFSYVTWINEGSR